jgi:outer membrane receptor protein involved in Fe transport
VSKLKLLVSAAAACCAASSTAWAGDAQTPANGTSQSPGGTQAATGATATGAATGAATGGDEVVVTGQHSDETRIDRHVYSVRNDPIAQTSSANDILARLPAVTVAPSGQIRLLGSSPTIQIDGQTVPGATLTQILRTMTGDQIDRIEIITNPSAQYSAQASGGIINIVTRQTFGRGLGGALVGNYDTTNSYTATFGPTWTRGAFSLAGRVGYSRNLSRADTDITRDIFAASDIVRQIGETHQESQFSNEFISFGYRPNNRINALFSLEHSDGHGGARQSINASHAAGPLFTEEIRTPNDFSGDRAVAGYTWNGAHNGESLTFNATLQRFQNDFNQSTTTQPAAGPLTQFLSPAPFTGRSANLKLDYQRTFGRALLSAGAAFDFNRTDNTDAFITSIGPPNPNDFVETLHGVQSTPAAYVTYQFPVGHLTFLPGIRFEDFAQDVHSSPAHARLSDPRFLPTLHVRRNLLPGLDLDASYTRKISHPGISQFDPALRFQDATHASRGNPDLRPSLTNAFELALNYQSGARNLNFTFYDRITDDTIAQVFDLTPEGVTISHPVNAGANELRGMQASIAQPFGRNWRLTTTFNLLERSFDQFLAGGSARSSEFEYNGNATLEYRDVDQNRIGAQQIQIVAQWQGPQHNFQTVSDNFAVLGVTWRRTLTERVASQLQLFDVFDSGRFRNTFRNDQLEEKSITHIHGNGGGRRLQLTLTYKLANPQAVAAHAS